MTNRPPLEEDEGPRSEEGKQGSVADQRLGRRWRGLLLSMHLMEHLRERMNAGDDAPQDLPSKGEI